MARDPRTPPDDDDAPAVPDAEGAPGPHDAIYTSPDLWGGDAVVRDADYGPPIFSRFPDTTTVTSEIRELERRVRARLTPAFPIEVRRARPLRSVWKRYRAFAMRDRSSVVDEMGRDPVYAARYAPILDLLYRRYFRATALGVEHIASSGRAILVANHSGALPYDALMLMRALELEHPAHRRVRPLLEDDVFHAPFLGPFMNKMGGVRANPENAERLLDDGELVAVFPEGIQGTGKLYRDRYRLQRFGRGGFIKLALRTRSPIIPVAVVGAEEASPTLGRVHWLGRAVGLSHLPLTPAGVLPLPSKWTLQFGAPIDLAAEHPPEAADDRLLVARLADGVRSQIQGMIDELLSRRGSALFG